MKAILTLKKWFAILLLILIINSCTVSPCFFPQYSRAGLVLRSNNQQLIGNDTLSNIAIIGVADSIQKIFRNGIYELPLNNSADSTSFLCTTKAGNTISFTLNHTSRIGLSTPECGYINYFDNLAVKPSGISSAKILSTSVDTTLKANIEISLIP